MVENLRANICHPFFPIQNSCLGVSVSDTKLMVLLVSFIYTVDHYFNLFATGGFLVEAYTNMWVKCDGKIWGVGGGGGCSDENMGDTRLMPVTLT